MNIHQKLVEIRKTIDGFTKDGASYGYKYVTGTQVLAKIKDKMDELDILLYPQVNDQQHEVHEYRNGKGKDVKDFLVFGSMTYKWVNAEKPEDFIEIPFQYMGQQDDLSKAFGSGLTYSERYFLLKFFGVPTDDDDPDNKKNSNRNNYNNNSNSSNNNQNQQNYQSNTNAQPNRNKTNTGGSVASPKQVELLHTLTTRYCEKTGYTEDQVKQSLTKHVGDFGMSYKQMTGGRGNQASKAIDKLNELLK